MELTLETLYKNVLYKWFQFLDFVSSSSLDWQYARVIFQRVMFN